MATFSQFWYPNFRHSVLLYWLMAILNKSEGYDDDSDDDSDDNGTMK